VAKYLTGPLGFLASTADSLTNSRISRLRFMVQGLALYLRRIAGQSGRPLDLQLIRDGEAFPLTVLSWSDLFLIREIFFHNVYDLEWTAHEPSRILDLGGHVGASVLYFKKRFPEARILVLEPDRTRYPVLQANTKRLSLVSLMPLAAWDRDGEVSLYSSPKGDWIPSLVQRSDSVVETRVGAIRLDTLFDQNPGSFPDLVKFDIEGAEFRVFSCFSKLSEIPVFVGEFHSELAGCSLETFLSLFDRTHKVSSREVIPNRYIIRASLRGL
jgi:FkbM family methyltransferase